MPMWILPFMFQKGVSHMSNILSLHLGRISQFFPPPQDIRALPGAKGTEYAGEIRVCIHEQLSHSDVEPKMTYTRKTCEKPLQQKN